MNFLKYLCKKISIAILSIILITSLLYVVIFAFINNEFLKSKSLMNQYSEFIGSIFSNFGKVYGSSSFQNAQSYFFNYYKWSLLFEGIAFVISIILGYFIGIFLAYKQGKWSDILISSLIFIFAAIPTFIFAPLMLILAEAIDLPVNFVDPSSATVGYLLLSLILPAALLSISSISFVSIVVKKATYNILKQEYITVLRATGQNSQNIFFKGVFKNLIGDTINQIIPMILLLISFGLIIERIFQIPGQSLILLSSFKDGEINVLMCLIFYKLLLLIGLTIIFEFVSDLINLKISFNFLQKHHQNRIIIKKLEKEGSDD
ncbi:ABC transporter permease subunit [Mycoplasmopsis felifaucium]|uniref:ABC transporter permease subunit n=1 Tax=Mycoplasmopsis felifaucium TaxID=35768 RepID=UPI00048260E3|nr:ABC transporter permease [Mycoplasmopsis felifaucium]